MQTDHWHPVLLSRDLRKKPARARLHGRDLALFRTADGKVGALEDRCPHRYYHLSLGRVVGDRLECGYHGWKFDREGNGESPGTPKLHACAESWDACEQWGAVWVKPRGVEAPLPTIDAEGHYYLGPMHHVAPAPLEPTLDNFCEIEHTPTVHAFFGYDPARIHEVKMHSEVTPSQGVRVVTVGAPRPVNWLYRLLLGVTKRYTFNDDWVTHFSPVHSLFKHWYSNPNSGREGLVRWRLYIFYTPIDDQTTALFSFPFVKSRYWGPYGLAPLFGWYLKHMISREIVLDVKTLSGLADYTRSLEGMKLGRFDRPLGLNREQLARIYRREPAKGT